MTTAQRWDATKKQWEDAVKGIRPDAEVFSAALTIGAARLGQILIIAANIKPYARLVSDLLSKVFGVSLWGLFDVGLGFVLLAGIQSAEIRPTLLHRPTAEKLKNVETIATLGFLLDAILAIYNWPPLRVPLSRFFAAPNFADVHWVNVLMIAAIVFGMVELEKLIIRVKSDL